MFSNSAKPTKQNLRARTLAIIEAADSGLLIGAKWSPKVREPKRRRREYVNAMKEVKAWAERAQWVIDREDPII